MIERMLTENRFAETRSVQQLAVGGVGRDQHLTLSSWRCYFCWVWSPFSNPWEEFSAAFLDQMDIRAVIMVASRDNGISPKGKGEGSYALSFDNIELIELIQGADNLPGVRNGSKMELSLNKGKKTNYGHNNYRTFQIKHVDSKNMLLAGFEWAKQ